MPVSGLILRPDEEANKEEVDDDPGWQSSIGHVHGGGDGRYEVRQHCTHARTDHAKMPTSIQADAGGTTG